MEIRLSDHFDYRRLLRFTFPSIVMMFLFSFYGIVDGYFVANFAGNTAFTAVNFIMPYVMILGSFGCMLGTGGSALIGKLLGEQRKAQANGAFSMLVHVSFWSSVLIAAAGILLARLLAFWIGAEGEMLNLTVLYGRIVLAGLPFVVLGMEFQSFFILAEKPKLGMFVTVLSGCTNMVLDALLVGVFSWGIAGAAAATVASQLLTAVVAIAYFARPNSSLLQLGRFRFRLRKLWLACFNGSSEMISGIAMSAVGILYNIQLLRFAGEDGVASYGVLMYLAMVFTACFFGYSLGIAPVISFHFGAQNHDELKSLLRKSLTLIGVVSLLMVVAGRVLAGPLSALFVGNDPELLHLTTHAFAIFSLSFLFCGVPMFGSSFFTALNDGLTSALISFPRIVFGLLAILIMPTFWGIEGIWWSIVVAEVSSMAMTTWYLWWKRNKFHYV